MKISWLAGTLMVGCCVCARAQFTDTIQLEISAETSLNMRTGARGANIYLAPMAPLQSRVRAGRVTLSHALDDTGAVLTQLTTGKFYSVSVGRIDDSKDLTSMEPASLFLEGVSKGARALSMISGTLELVVPDLDPSSTVVVGDIPTRYGAAIESEALARAGVTLVLFDKKSADAAAAAKVVGGPQDFDGGTMFGHAFNGAPPGFPGPSMDEGDVAVAIDDPQEHVVGLEIQAQDGSPLRYDHAGYYHSSGVPGGPGKRFDVYRVGAGLPDNARVVCWLVTKGSLLKLPFHIDTLPLPEGGRRALGMMTVPVEGAVLKTREALGYQEAHADSRAESAPPQAVDRIVQLWSDVPEYVAILRKDMHYKKLPKLISSVAPELPPIAIPRDAPVKVVVSFVVDASGGVEAARVLESNDDRFNIASVEAVLRWKFRPAEAEGGPAIAIIKIPFVFGAPRPPQPGPGAPASG